MTSITHKETNLKSKTQDDESMIMTCQGGPLNDGDLLSNSDLSSLTPQICSKTTYDTATVPPVAGSSHNQPHIVILINTASTTLHWLRKPPHTAPPFAGSSSRNTTTICWRRFPTMACGG
ncbi:hypothetical protein JHK85_054930 [Glycine max]|nr:hypothetical protein JHK85_054930 [Glycine max]